MTEIKKILVVRFRQIGDAILSTALCSTLKRTFPGAELHFVVNKGIAPLFEGHPDIDKVIAFEKHELKPLPTYLKRVKEIVTETRYDIIIDMRSTLNSLMFAALSHHTPFRIGGKKPYSPLFLTDSIDFYSSKIDGDMVKRNLLLTKPLEKIAPVKRVTDFSIHVGEEERLKFRTRMEAEGVDFSRPVMLAGVTTKIASKCWDKSYMVETLRRFIAEHGEWQLIFNYAPGVEESDAREMFRELGSPSNVMIDIKASSLRELAAMTTNCDLYFGNEGGARHLAQALGVPSLAIFSPIASPGVWLPPTSTPAEGISIEDYPEAAEIDDMEHKFHLIKPDDVYRRLVTMISKLN